MGRGMRGFTRLKGYISLRMDNKWSMHIKAILNIKFRPMDEL
jgi:hypothetical protein